MTAHTFDRVAVPGTRMAFSSLVEWCQLVMDRDTPSKASSRNSERAAAVQSALTPALIRPSRDRRGLEAVRQLLDGAKRWPHVPRWEAGPAHLAALRVATHNRLHQLITGAADRNRIRHGPADPTAMPDRALDRVIQTCKNMELVEQCRAERARRLDRGLEVMTDDQKRDQKPVDPYAKQRAYRERQAKAGLVKVQVLVPAAAVETIKKAAQDLREAHQKPQNRR